MLKREIRASLGIVERNLNLMRRYFSWEMVFIVYSLVNTLTIALIGVAAGSASKTLYLVIGAVLWGFLSLLFHEVSESIAWERWEGTIEYSFMAPVRRLSYLLGNCLYAVIYGTLRTVFILVVAAAFLKLNIKGANLSSAVLVLAVSSFSFIGLGLCAAVLPLISPEKGTQATHIIQATILLVSGVYYEVSVLPGWLEPFSKISPATYTLKAIRMALLDGAGVRELSGYIFILIFAGIILIPAGLFIFYLGERHAKRVGKLSRDG